MGQIVGIRQSASQINDANLRLSNYSINVVYNLVYRRRLPMSDMVRKQIYISRRQQTLLKRLAEARGLSEAEVIRQAIDREASHATPQPGRKSQDDWEQAHAVMLSLLDDASKFTEAIHWNREDLYAERLGRFRIQDKPTADGSFQE
jgi:hypothetical protein